MSRERNVRGRASTPVDSVGDVVVKHSFVRPCPVHALQGVARASANEKCPNIKEATSLLGTLCARLISQSRVCGEEAGSWPSALKARGLDSSVLLELLIIP